MDLPTLESMTHFEHSRKVSQISGLLAQANGFDPKTAQVIEHAALYHDVGKSSIPASILYKPGKLTPEEFELVKRHTSIGSRQINKVLRILTLAASLAQYHHESYDGTGYHGLAGEEIPQYARLVAVADVFDALISKRVYKEAWGADKVLKYLEDNAGTQFDNKYVKLLLDSADKILELYQNDNKEDK
jgi:HD-GYP domain-containing protein (c-di-GMP phosphodiesterase class II)